MEIQNKLYYEIRFGNWLSIDEIDFMVDWNTLHCIFNDEIGNIEFKPSPVKITKEWLVKSEFEKKPLTTWKGNGQDYQPETSKTEQQDYFLSEHGFIVRYESWSYRKTEKDKWITESSIQLFNTDDWYPKTIEGSIWIDYNLEFIHQLQNIFYFVKQKELTFNN